MTTTVKAIKGGNVSGENAITGKGFFTWQNILIFVVGLASLAFAAYLLKGFYTLASTQQLPLPLPDAGEAFTPVLDTGNMLLASKAIASLLLFFFGLSALAILFSRTLGQVFLATITIFVILVVMTIVLDIPAKSAYNRNNTNVETQFSSWAEERYGITMDEKVTFTLLAPTDKTLIRYNNASEAATLHLVDTDKWLLYDLKNENELPVSKEAR